MPVWGVMHKSMTQDLPPIDGWGWDALRSGRDMRDGRQGMRHGRGPWKLWDARQGGGALMPWCTGQREPAPQSGLLQPWL